MQDDLGNEIDLKQNFDDEDGFERGDLPMGDEVLLENELNEEFSIESVEDDASEFEDEDSVAPLDPEDIFSEDDLIESDL